MFVKGPQTKQFIVLVEGIVEAHDGVDSGQRTSSNHGHYPAPPRHGRLVELLPNVANPGPWMAKMVAMFDDGGNSSREDIPIGQRIFMRHADYQKLPPLTRDDSAAWNRISYLEGADERNPHSI